MDFTQAAELFSRRTQEQISLLPAEVVGLYSAEALYYDSVLYCYIVSRDSSLERLWLHTTRTIYSELYHE